MTVVTAPSGSGKTTFCAGFIKKARESGLSVGGFICPAVFENGIKIGIDMIDVASGERRRLATRSDLAEATIGYWKMDESTLEWGNEIIAVLQEEDVIVIDELGPIEFEQSRGYWRALRLLDEGRYRIALAVVRPSLLSLAQTRWPDVRVLKLD